MPRVRRASRTIPSSTSGHAVYEINDYSLGMNSFVSNDKFALKNGGQNQWRLAQDARITTLGEYDSRKGFDFNSDAAGETEDQTITSTTGAADASFNEVDRLAQKWTAGTTGRLSKVQLNLKNASSASGTIIVEHWTDSSGPSELVARTSISDTALSASYGYITARFPDAPVITSATSYWIVVYVQSTGSGSFSWSSTTSATTAQVSDDSGTSWASTSYALNFKQFYATDAPVKGLHRAYKSDGTKITLFAQGTTLYSVSESTGALTAVRTGLNSSATHYRFVTVNDVVYYVNGYDGLRKYDFTSETQVTATNYTHITEHKGMLFLVTEEDPNKMVFSNFADYETFTSTDFVYVPSPKTGDPITAIESLNGYLIIATQDNKFILSGSDNATYSLDESPDQYGTYTQETMAADDNFIYYLADSGVYRSNGAEPQLMSESIYDDIVKLQNKNTCCMAVNRGRLYLWFRSGGSSINDSCYVWNLNYGSGSTDMVESLDTEAYVSRAVSGFFDNDNMLVGSSVIGQVYWQEKDSNDNTNLGGDINFELQTHYMTFNSPAVLKEIRRWIPRFGAQDNSYTMKCDYATDLRDNWTTQIYSNVQGVGSLWGSATWGSFTWGSTAEVQESDYVPGEYRRIAIRYKHHATRQPQKFLGHTLEVQTRRLR
jgi:hypothetical protein